MVQIYYSATTARHGSPGFESRTCKTFFSSSEVPERLDPSQPLFKGYRGTKRRRREVNYPPPSTDEFKNERIYIFFHSPIHLEDMDRESLTF